MIGLAWLLLESPAATAMPAGEDAAWVAAWAQAGVSLPQAEQVRVDVVPGTWRVTVEGVTFEVEPPRTQADREDLAALVASALSTNLPPLGERPTTTPAADVGANQPPPPRPPSSPSPHPSPYLLVEAGVRLWNGRATVPTYAVVVGAESPHLHAEMSVLLTTPAEVWAAGPGRAQASGRLAGHVGVGDARAVLLVGAGLEASRFTDQRTAVHIGALPDASLTVRLRPATRQPFLFAFSAVRTLGLTRVYLDGSEPRVLSPWRAGASIAYEHRP